jgi:catechol 2,3-dioxygenase-like lactoylglutathione lyase family enzyme
VLYSEDPKDSGEFYEKLGFRPVAIMDEIAVMELRGGTHLVIRRQRDGEGRAADFDLMVEDLDATWQAWSADGVTVSEIEKDERAIHRIFTVTDPDGNTIVVNDSHVVGPV